MHRSTERGRSAEQRFAAAYRQHAATVLGYLRARGVEDPEAVTQDVFLALHPRLADLEGGDAGLRTLLFSIAHARVVDQHRARTRGPEQVAYDPETDRRTTASAEEAAVGTGTGVIAKLARLSPEHREVLALRVVGDLSLEATADIMGRSVDAVKQLQRRALVALRRELALQDEVVA